MTDRSTRPLRRLAPVFAAMLLATTPVPLRAQESAAAVPAPASPVTNAGRLSFTGGIDVLNSYMFRGIRQDDRGIVAWPAGDLGVVLFDGEGALRSVGLNVGLWNSLHSGPTGRDGPTGKMWYESDFYSSLTFALRGGVRIGTSYTAYLSPNNSFRTVKEVAFTVALDDSGRPLPLSPYALIAREIDGQADGGARRGTYLELGVKPGVSAAADRLTMSFPAKVGLSLQDYYEGPAGSSTFGYVEAGAVASVPLTFVAPGFGVWSVRGGVSVLGLGAALRSINGGRRAKVVGLFGVGLSY